jgi:hypothetical protein
MTEHRRNIMVTACLEAQAHYTVTAEKHRAFSKGVRDCTSIEKANSVIAEAYLMRVETITKGE